jgi:hypothetical protein
VVRFGLHAATSPERITLCTELHDVPFVEKSRDFLWVPRLPRGRKKAGWPPVPDLFDVITYFRARGDSFVLIASIAFWIGDTEKKALTARGLKFWYEAELDRKGGREGSDTMIHAKEREECAATADECAQEVIKIAHSHPEGSVSRDRCSLLVRGMLSELLR